MKVENLDDLERPVRHKLIADCPDCGRMEVHKGRCSKCHGESWLPAGYFDRKWLKRARKVLEGNIST